MFKTNFHPLRWWSYFSSLFPIRPTFLHVCQPIEKNGSTTGFLLLFISALAVEQLKFLSFSSFAENNRMLFVELLLRWPKPDHPMLLLNQGSKSKCRNWISCPKSKSFSKGQFNEAYFLQYFEPFLKIFYQHHDKKNWVFLLTFL